MSRLWKVPLKLLRVPLAFASGVAWEYLFDPVSGRGRRTRLRDQIYAWARRVVRTAARRGRYRAGRARGALYRAIHLRAPLGTVDDDLLLQKIRSEALGPSPIGDVDLEVRHGVVFVSGASRDPGAEEALLEKIAAIGGVHHVRNRLSPA